MTEEKIIYSLKIPGELIGTVASIYQEIINWFKIYHDVSISVTPFERSGVKKGFQYIVRDNSMSIRSVCSHLFYYEVMGIAIEEAFKLIGEYRNNNTTTDKENHNP